jgi:hypothetical protein
MAGYHKTPGELAKKICSELKRRRKDCPPSRVIGSLCEVLYYTSIKVEEGVPVTCYVVYLDPRNPDPTPPPRITQDRWQSFKLADPIPLTVDNLAKMSKASDPRSSSIAVYGTSDGNSSIWGLVDQGNSYYDFANHDSDRGQTRPGLFQMSILGLGNIVAYLGYEIIAELRVNRLITRSLDVLKAGHIYQKLQPGISAHIEAVRATVADEMLNWDAWESSLEYDWLYTLCRIIKRTQNYRHGGAILVTDKPLRRALNVKYPLEYTRLRRALQNHGTFAIKRRFYFDQIYRHYLRTGQQQIPREAFQRYRIAERDLAENVLELDGCVWFVSLLSRVDGLVALSRQLEVRGFGAEITIHNEPPQVFLARGLHARPEHLSALDYNHYGTRHRSMMRYCLADDSAVGLVVSQDGGVRAVTKVQEKVVLWDGIRLDKFSYTSSVERPT